VCERGREASGVEQKTFDSIAKPVIFSRPLNKAPFACDDSPGPHASVQKVTLLPGDEDSPVSAYRL